MIEYLAFGKSLERVRAWCLGLLDLNVGSKVLLVGDGDGRFLCALLAHFYGVRVDFLEPSRAMSKVAKRRAACDARVAWCQAGIQDWNASGYDAVIAHFVLDVFHPDCRKEVIGALASKVRQGGVLVVSDFDEPPGGLCTLRMWLMQWFLYLLEGQPLWEVSKNDTPFSAGVAELSHEKSWYNGWIYSEIWKIS